VLSNSRLKRSLDEVRDAVEDVLTTALGKWIISAKLTKLTRKNDNIIVEGKYEGLLEEGTFRIVLNSKTLDVVEYEIK